MLFLGKTKGDLGRLGAKGLGVQVILSYMVRFRAAWATGNPSQNLKIVKYIGKILAIYSFLLSYTDFKTNLRAGEMSHRLRALVDLLEDLNLIPSTHRAAYNCL